MKAKDKFQFKRDVHKCNTAFTSNPPKRKRRTSEVKHGAIEKMDVEEEDEVLENKRKLEETEIIERKNK